MITIKGASPKTFRLLALLLALTVLTACPSIEYAKDLRDAQDDFSTAAMAENLQTLNGLPGTDPEVYYRKSLNRLAAIDEQGETVLKQNELLGSKYALEALAHWKLQQPSEALAARSKATKEPLASRDRIMMEALPALLIIDEPTAINTEAEATRRRRALMGPSDPPDLSSSEGNDALAHLSRARKLAEGHAVDRVLLRHQLAVYAELADSYRAFSASARVPDWLLALMKEGQQELARDGNEYELRQWSRRLGLDMPQ